MNKCLVCFNGIPEVVVVKAAFINDLSKPSEGITTEIKSFLNLTKVINTLVEDLEGCFGEREPNSASSWTWL